MNYYPFHIGDYRSATMHLTNEEDLAYRRLLDFYYDTEAPIPLDTQQVSRRLRVGSQHIETVLQDFFKHTVDGWIHERCDVEIAEYKTRADRSRRNGANGGRRKAAPALEKNPAGSQQDPSSNPEQTQALANQEPRTKNQEPVTKERDTAARGSRLPADFALPDEWITFCETERKDLNPYEAGKRFADYWHGVAGAKGRKADWFATWRNWVRNEKTQQTAAAPRESFKERDARLAREQFEQAIGRRSTHARHDAIDVTPDVPFLEYGQ